MRKLCLFALPFSAAALAGCYLLSPPGLALLGGAALVLLLPAALSPLARPLRRRAMLVLLGLGLGALWTALWTLLFHQPAQELVGEHPALTATAAGYPQATGYGWKVEVELHTSGGRVRALMYLEGEQGGVEPGDRLSCAARLSSAAQSRGSTVFWHTARGISLLVYPRGAVLVEPGAEDALRFLPVRALRLLTGAVSQVFGAEDAPLVNAVLTGDRSGLSGAFSEALSRSGLAHAVAVSGMHISFLAGAVSLLLGRRRRLAAAALLPVLVFFTLMVGATPSVVRSALMHGLLLAAPLLGRETDGPTSLAFALLLILLPNPYAAASVGLQLSFAAVAGQLLVSGRLYRWLRAPLEGLRPKGLFGKAGLGLLRGVWASLASTAGALLFTIPLTALHFGEFPLLAPLSNLLCLWAVSLLFLGGLAAALLGLLFLPLGLLAAGPVSLAAAWFRWVVLGTGSFSFAALPLNTPYYLLAFPVVYAALLLPALLPRGSLRPAVVLFCAILPLSGAILLSSLTSARSALTLSVLDVGQGASAALLSGNATALVDCGGNTLDGPGAVAADYFQGQGFSRLDCLVLTHCHRDHVGGLEVLFARMEVEHLFLPRTSVRDEDSLEGEVLALAAAEGCTIHWVEETCQIALGEAVLTLYPSLGGGGTNEEGLTVLTEAASFRALITGDANHTVEAMMVRYLDLPPVEVLVAGHHGSKYAASEALLEAVTPQAAILSVGWNPYGHPAPETLARLAQRGIHIYRTDLAGTVTVTVGAA